MAGRTRRRIDIPQSKNTSLFIDDVFVFDQKYVSSTKTDVMTDVSSPFAKNIMRNGGIINNDMRFTRVETKVSGGGGMKYKTSPSTLAVRSLVGSPTAFWLSNFPAMLAGSIPLQVKVDANALAKQQAISRINKAPNGALEDIGEIRETLRFLRAPMSSLLRLSKSFSKKANKKARREKLGRTKAFADVWLEYRFAASPLIRSMESIIDGIGRTRKKPEKIRSSGFVGTNQDANDVFTSFQKTSIRSTSLNLSTRAGIRYSVSNPVGDVRFIYGLRARDVPETLWNLLPLSFMVDRVINISSSIQAFTNLVDPNVKILNGWITTKETKVQTAQLSDHSSLTILSLTADVHTRKSFEYRRLAWSPSILDTIAPINYSGLINSVTNIMDLGSLIVSFLRPKN